MKLFSQPPRKRGWYSSTLSQVTLLPFPCLQRSAPPLPSRPKSSFFPGLCFHSYILFLWFWPSCLLSHQQVAGEIQTQERAWAEERSVGLLAPVEAQCRRRVGKEAPARCPQPMFSFWKFVVLGLTSKSSIHFELIFMLWAAFLNTHKMRSRRIKWSLSSFWFTRQHAGAFLKPPRLWEAVHPPATSIDECGCEWGSGWQLGSWGVGPWPENAGVAGHI